jgi:hypothetical protein
MLLSAKITLKCSPGFSQRCPVSVVDVKDGGLIASDLLDLGAVPLLVNELSGTKVT